MLENNGRKALKGFKVIASCHYPEASIYFCGRKALKGFKVIASWTIPCKGDKPIIKKAKPMSDYSQFDVAKLSKALR